MLQNVAAHYCAEKAEQGHPLRFGVFSRLMHLQGTETVNDPSAALQ